MSFSKDKLKNKINFAKDSVKNSVKTSMSYVDLDKSNFKNIKQTHNNSQADLLVKANSVFSGMGENTTLEKKKSMLQIGAENNYSIKSVLSQQEHEKSQPDPSKLSTLHQVQQPELGSYQDKQPSSQVGTITSQVAEAIAKDPHANPFLAMNQQSDYSSMQRDETLTLSLRTKTPVYSYNDTDKELKGMIGKGL